MCIVLLLVTLSWLFESSYRELKMNLSRLFELLATVSSYRELKMTDAVKKVCVPAEAYF